MPWKIRSIAVPLRFKLKRFRYCPKKLTFLFRLTGGTGNGRWHESWPRHRLPASRVGRQKQRWNWRLGRQQQLYHRRHYTLKFFLVIYSFTFSVILISLPFVLLTYLQFVSCNANIANCFLTMPKVPRSAHQIIENCTYQPLSIRYPIN